jgi:predicted DNA-binding mobile mystery protein A
MRDEFKHLRQKQLDRSLEPFSAARKQPRPQLGWIHAIRQTLGISAADLARVLGRSRQLVLQLEKAEAEDTITLKSLRNIANALDCDLTYALVPREGTIREMNESRARTNAREHVSRIEHSMALEDQAAGHIDDAVEAEIQRRVKRSGSKK